MGWRIKDCDGCGKYTWCVRPREEDALVAASRPCRTRADEWICADCAVETDELAREALRELGMGR